MQQLSKARNWLPLHRCLAVGRAPTAVVAYRGIEPLTWGELGLQVAAYCRWLQAQAQQRWLLTTDDAGLFAVQLLALAQCGRDAVLPPNVLPGTLQRLQARYDAVLPARWAEGPSPVAAGGEVPVTWRVTDPRAMQLELYTSGTTGEPKAIRKTLEQFEAEAMALESLWGELAAEAVVVGSAPPLHLYGLTFRVCWPLMAGRPLQCETLADPHAMAHGLHQHPGAMLISTPAQLTRWPDLMDLQTLATPPRLLVSSAGPLPLATAQRLRADLRVEPFEIFGSSETGVIAWRAPCQSPSWTPVPTVQVAQIAEQRLRVNSPFCSTSNETGAADWTREPAGLIMDDRVAIAADGRFDLLGRADRTVKIEEKRLNLPDMEAQLQRHPQVQQAAVLVLPTAPLGDAEVALLRPGRPSLAAVLVLTPAGQADLLSLGRRRFSMAMKAFLANYFDAVLLPKRWRYVAALPFDARGKLSQTALTELFQDE